MLTIKRIFHCLIVLSFFFVTEAQAVEPVREGTVFNSYFFIENDENSEYFITSATLDPRFTGANVWTKHRDRQVTLGYIGYALWYASNHYFDMWFTNSPINQPFTGIRCFSTGNDCPSSGSRSANVIDKDGFYHSLSGNNLLNGNFGTASLSQTAYEYFRTQSVGSKDNLELNFCYTNINYDYASGVRCKDLDSNASWRQLNYELTKVGHLKLKSNPTLSEIYVASDGTASVEIDSDVCRVGVVYNISGVICKMLAYSLEESRVLTSTLDFTLLVDNSALGFIPLAYDVMYSGDGVRWLYYTVDNDYSSVLTPGEGHVNIFLSDSFFEKVLNTGAGNKYSDSVFSFYFSNKNTPESGFYQFSASTKINIVPREYGISIISSDGSGHPHNSGNIGDENPIEFEYKVVTSAARQADSITAQVTGESVELDGVPWCLFSSPNRLIQVPIPAYLSWTSKGGASVVARNSCGEPAVDMTEANWVETAWNASVNDGHFYTTTLKLQFPMDHERSAYTTRGHEWMGTVNASGEVKVTARWIGVEGQ